MEEEGSYTMKLVNNRVEVRTKVSVSSPVLLPTPCMVCHTGSMVPGDQQAVLWMI